MIKLVELFCDIDDFCKVFIPQWEKQLLENGTQKRQRSAFSRNFQLKIKTAFKCFNVLFVAA